MVLDGWQPLVVYIGLQKGGLLCCIPVWDFLVTLNSFRESHGPWQHPNPVDGHNHLGDLNLRVRGSKLRSSGADVHKV